MLEAERAARSSRVAVVVFPGSNCDLDVLCAFRDVLGVEADYVWHEERDLSAFDLVVLPGGFSYGDYLRPGALARFSPVMEAVREFAASGKPVLGICNGFQILCEAGLLPGVLRRNADLRFHCQWVWVRVERVDTPFTCLCLPGEVLRLPIAHGDGNFYAPEPVWRELEAGGQVVFRYCDRRGECTPASNPNGSLFHIAGVSNPAGNVVGLMPHPERAVEELLGGTDGRKILLGALAWLRHRGRGAEAGSPERVAAAAAPVLPGGGEGE